MAETKIEWAERVWNPVTGCSKVSSGCKNCYAEVMFNRLAAIGQKPYTGRKFTDVKCHEDRLKQPLRWRKPSRVFVNSMSDLFHPEVPVSFIAEVFDTMASWRLSCRKDHDHDDSCVEDPKHTYQILTKRAERMRRVVNEEMGAYVGEFWPGDSPLCTAMDAGSWPLGNVWLGVSVGSAAEKGRIEELRRTGSYIRFISFEPLLADVRELNLEGIHWVIIGGESGRDHRPMNLEWLEHIEFQCRLARVPLFVKQDSGRFPGRQGRIPDKLWVKEYPQ